MNVWENSKLRGNTRGSLVELEIAWKHSWKFGRTRNCVETLVEVWENSKLRGNTRGSLGELEIALLHSPCELMFQFLIFPNFHSCFYNSMEIRKMFFLLEK